MSEVVAFAEFEGAKENILPLKQGRNPLQLRNAFAPKKETPVAKDLNKEREEHEKKILEYNGSDPLSPWLEYIRWMQQAYPQGGKDSHLVGVLEKCTEKFKADPQYKDNVRYLKVWLIYTDCLRDPEDTFAFLDHNCIGRKFSLLYEAWALALERKEKFSRAEEVLKKGIQAHALPLAKLKSALKGLILRASKKDEAQDYILAGSLRGQPTEFRKRRAFDSISKRRRLANSSRSSQSNVLPVSASTDPTKESNFQIFADASTRQPSHNPNNSFSRAAFRRPSSTSSTVPQAEQLNAPIWKSLGSQDAAEKENQGMVTTWNGGLASCASSKTKKTTAKPSFAIFADGHVDPSDGEAGVAKIEVAVPKDCTELQQGEAEDDTPSALKPSLVTVTKAGSMLSEEEGPAISAPALPAPVQVEPAAPGVTRKKPIGRAAQAAARRRAARAANKSATRGKKSDVMSLLAKSLQAD